MPAKAAKKNGRGARQARGEHARPPRDSLFRARRPGIELRAADDGGDGGMPTLFGHFLRFNEWTEIDSFFEGRFLERVAPGATKKTISEQRDSMRCLFQHGMDFNIGDKPLGPIDELREDKEGAYYEVPLLDTAYVRDDLLPGLEADLYGASFRFRVLREEFVEEPDPSDYNPKGLPERTIKEMEVREFGPVTFPAYPGATAGVRSLTDEFLMRGFTRDRERAGRLLGFAGMRADAEDIGTLAQMLALAAEYIDEQDEDDEQPNIDTMQGIVVSLTGLLSVEAEEVEPADEPEDEDEENSADEPVDTEGRNDEEPDDTTSQEAADEEPAEEQEDEPETDDAGDRSTSATGRTPLRPYKGKETTSWPRL